MSQEKQGLVGFSPGYFALVMATGIVSLAAHDHGWLAAARVLLALNTGMYGVLWVLSILRFARHRPAVMFDLSHHSRGALFLTNPAATSILGCQFRVLTPWPGIATGLWFVAVILGVVLSYSFIAVITIREPKPTLESGIGGSWLLIVVSAESIGVLGALLAPQLGNFKLVLFVALTAYLAGAMLYIFFITLILYRWMFFRMLPKTLTPDYWIDMGALAITTLAGAELLQVADRWTLLQDMSSFLIGFTMLFWATATWWIPLLLIVELWRHLFGGVPIVYRPEYWSLVFPLGTYSAATFMLTEITGMPALNYLSIAFAGIALVAWALTFFGMAHGLVRRR